MLIAKLLGFIFEVPRFTHKCKVLLERPIRNPRFQEMLMNWPERLWIYSPIREIFQRREVTKWLKFAEPQKKGVALEIGCGLGRGARLMIDKMGFSEVVAFDLEEILVRRARFLTPVRLRRNIAYYVGDAQYLPFPDDSFDAIVNFGIIHHVLDWRQCLREISRTLRKGGTFYFEEIYPPLYANFILKPLLRHPTEDRFSEKEFLHEFKQNRLELIDGFETGSRFGIVAAAKKT